MSAGAWVLLASLAAALAFGLYRAATDGRFRGTRAVAGRVASGASVSGPGPSSVEPVETTTAVVAGLEPDQLGERATLLQFSSAFCAPCRAARRVLSDVATTVPGVTHHELDAEHHLEVVRSLGILRTPTTLVLDAEGREITRAQGAPSKAQVLAELGRAL